MLYIKSGQSIDDRLRKHGCFVVVFQSGGMYPYVHSHSGVEIVLVHNGHVEMTAEPWQCEAQAGTAVVVYGPALHGTRVIKPPFVRTLIAASFGLVDAQPIISSSERPLATALGYCVPLPADAFQRCLWAAQQLRHLTARAIAPPSTLRGLIGLVLADIEAGFSNEMTGAPGAPNLLDDILEYMNTHLQSDESLAELAGRFYIDERQLYRFFHSQVGTTPHDYWLELKMQRACQLLATKVPVAAVAAEVGFATISGFQRAFKRIYGITPSKHLAEAPSRTALPRL